jgi:hypothetical protein
VDICVTGAHTVTKLYGARSLDFFYNLAWLCSAYNIVYTCSAPQSSVHRASFSSIPFSEISACREKQCNLNPLNFLIYFDDAHISFTWN